MKEEDTNMEIKRPAIAGTLVSSVYGGVSIICLISGLILGVIKL